MRGITKQVSTGRFWIDSQRIRKRIDEAIGWIKTVAGQERTKFRAASASDGPSPLRPPLTTQRGCRSSTRPREVCFELSPNQPLADRRGGSFDRDHLDLCGPAILTITAQGGDIAFGALEAGLEVEYARDSIGFRWQGSDEGEGTAELLEDDTIEIELPTIMATKPSSIRATGVTKVTYYRWVRSTAG